MAYLPPLSTGTALSTVASFYPTDDGSYITVYEEGEMPRVSGRRPVPPPVQFTVLELIKMAIEAIGNDDEYCSIYEDTYTIIKKAIKRVKQRQEKMK